MKIKTKYVYPPIPIRRFDWSAIDADTYDGEGPIGFGATMTYMAQELRIGAMVRALHGIDLDNPTARAAVYVRANALAKGDL